MKLIVENYTFDASLQTITFTDYNPIVIERVLLITNVVDNVIIYNFADATKGGTAATNVLTLTYDTTSMADADELQIIYDDVDTDQSVTGTVTAELSAIDNAVLDTIDAVLDTINTKLVSGTVIGDVNLGATDNAVLDDIAAKLGTIDNMISGSEAQVDVVAPLPAGTNAIGKLAANSGVDIGDVNASGLTADDAAFSGNPLVMGARAVETDGTDPTSVSAEGDAATIRSTRDRRLLVSDVSPRLASVNTTETTAQTHDALITAPGAGLSIYVTDIVVSNGATAGTLLFEEDTAAAQTVKVPLLYLGINGGAVMNFKTPIRITANTNFGATAATLTTYSILINYYIAP